MFQISIAKSKFIYMFQISIAKSKFIYICFTAQYNPTKKSPLLDSSTSRAKLFSEILIQCINGYLC